MAKKDASPLGAAIQQWLKTMRLKQGVTAVKVREAWMAIIGPELAEQCTEVNLRGEQLYVKMKSDVMRQEMGYAAEKLQSHLNKELGAELVTRIHFY